MEELLWGKFMPLFVCRGKKCNIYELHHRFTIKEIGERRNNLIVGSGI
jgi:hypothetical protein